MTADALALPLGGAQLCRDWFDPLCALYREVFSVPPHHAAQAS